MSFGKWRGAALACAITAVLGWASTGISLAGDFHKSIPREVEAYDYSTGGPYYAPPVPYGHYAKDKHAEIAKAIGCVTCKLKGLCSLGGCALLHHCGDGKCGHGLGGLGSGCGHGEGAGCGQGGHGAGCGHGLFGHGQSGAVAGTAYDPSFGQGSGHGHHGGGQIISTGQVISQVPGQVIASSQEPCGVGGCGFKGNHSHGGNAMGKMPCGLCHGRGADARGAGCGFCGGAGMADSCGGCGGRGCDGCKGLGCHGLGAGCNGLCGKLAAAGAAAHGLLGGAHSKIAGLFAKRQKIEYFVGPGGPVPITPGYVPYVITTRSPRDFFSFAPMNPNDPYP